MGFIGNLGPQMAQWYGQRQPEEQPMPQQPQGQPPIDFTEPQFQARPPMGMDQARQELDVAGQRSAWAAGKHAEADARQRQQADAITNKGIIEREQNVAELAKYREEQVMEFQRRSDSLRQRIQQQAQQTVDQSKFFRDQGTWGNILLGLSVAIGGFLNPRGPNLAMQAIERRIEQDLAIQGDNLDRKEKALHTEEGLLDSDRHDADDLFKNREWRAAQAWEMVGIKAKQMAEATSDAQAKAVAMEIVAQAQQKSAERSFKLAEEQQKREDAIKIAKINTGPQYMQAKLARDKYDQQQQDEAIYGKPAMLNAQDSHTRRMQAEAAQTRAATTAQKAQGVTFTDPVLGQQLQLKPTVRYNDVIKKVGNYASFFDSMEEVQKIGEDQGLWDRRTDILNTGSKTTHELKSIYNKMMLDLVGLKDRGAAIPETEMAYLKGQVGDGPDTWSTKDYSDRLKKVRQLYDSEYRRYLQLISLEEGVPAGGSSGARDDFDNEKEAEGEDF